MRTLRQRPAMVSQMVLIAVFLFMFVGLRASYASSEPELTQAVEKGDIAAVKDLLDKGADVGVRDSHGTTALALAALRGYNEIVEILLAEGARINDRSKNGFTPLMNASKKGHIEIVKTLLAKGADINAVNGKKETALMLATEAGNGEIVQLLEEYKQAHSKK